MTTPVSDSAIPFSTTASLNTGSGGLITSSYKIYDNGTSAGLSINSVAATTAINNDVGESTQYDYYSGKYTTFTFNQSVNYTLTISGTGTVATGFNAVFGDVSVDRSSGTGAFFTYQIPQGSFDRTVTGVFPAGLQTLDETWSVGNPPGTPDNNPVLNATDSIVFTFTPVPETSSAALAAMAGASLIRRHRPDDGADSAFKHRQR